ncbi:MAG: PAS domain S-box protein [Vicinamibacterales bacterium]
MKDSELNVYLAAIVDSSDDAIISKDLNGTIKSFNPAAERMFGYAPSEIIGQSVLRLIPSDLQQEEYEILARLRRGERIDHYETVRVSKDGRRIDVSLTVSPVRGPDGMVVGASKIARDITDRKRAAAQIAQQQEWFRVTLNSIGDAVIASDCDGNVTFLNHEAERLTGWSGADAVGRSLASVFHIVNEETRQAVENPAQKVLELGQVVGLANHTILIARGGTEWPIADSAAPIVEPHGKTIGVVLVFRETTELMAHQQRMRLAAEERERLLHSERAARTEAERANRVKDDFVAMVSHELRTPLNAILGWADLLRSGSLDAATQQHGLEVLSRNTRLQAQLISDLLDVSRIVSGKLRLELQSADLEQVVRNSVEALETAAAGKEIELQARFESDPPIIVGDPARLQQIVLNLVSNAIKFTPSSGRVTVALRTTGDVAEITVTDTGIGIRPELIPDLFERFRQGSSMTTRQHGGLGLGLSITKHLTELHGGSIHAWSDGPDKGATFKVQLPLERTGEVATRPLQLDDDVTAQAAHDVSFAGMTILVVEDDPDTRDLVRRLLEAHRAEVLVAASAPEALELLVSKPPDMLVSDIGLPDVDGYELMARLRKMDGPESRIPAIALTAFARSEDRTRALAAGFSAHVAKPVEPTELLMTVDSFVKLINAGRTP